MLIMLYIILLIVIHIQIVHIFEKESIDISIPDLIRVNVDDVVEICGQKFVVVVVGKVGQSHIIIYATSQSQEQNEDTVDTHLTALGHLSFMARSLVLYILFNQESCVQPRVILKKFIMNFRNCLLIAKLSILFRLDIIFLSYSSAWSSICNFFFQFDLLGFQQLLIKGLLSEVVLIISVVFFLLKCLYIALSTVQFQRLIFVILIVSDYIIKYVRIGCSVLYFQKVIMRFIMLVCLCFPT